MAKRKTVVKNRNAGTMSESAFWGWIRSSLRRKTMHWKPQQIAKDMAKVPKKGKIGRHKFEYKCAVCGGYFQFKEIQIDHKIEAGSLMNAQDLPGFVERLFCEVDGFQVLCHKRLDGKKSCHYKKTHKNK